MFDSPNLDALSTDAIDYYEAARVLKMLAEYAENKSVSMDYRSRGMIDLAIARERKLERIYRGLPEWARW